MTVPKGKNDLQTKELFSERVEYEKVLDEKNVTPINLWEDYKLLYGRVDVCGDPIFLREDKLVEIFNGDNGPLFIFDVIAEAYEEMQLQITRAEFLNRLNPDNSNIFPLVPAKTWRSVHQDYHEYLQTMYRSFSSGYLNKQIDKKIIDYKSFEKEFINFYTMVRSAFAFTRTDYITSGQSTPLMSGLMIEFSLGDHGDDEFKYNSYVNDELFELYTDITGRYGFAIDKNAPWRIIADLESQPMIDRFKRAGINNTQDFFQNYYYSSHLLDLETIASYMHKLWDSFATLYPVVKDADVSNCGPGLISNYIQRRRVSLREFLSVYKDKHWVSLYIKIRNLETNKSLPDVQIKLVTKNALDVLKYKGKDAALNYVQSVFGGFNNQVYSRKPLTEESIAATIQNVQNQVAAPTTTGY